jgi:hypothetical protein
MLPSRCAAAGCGGRSWWQDVFYTDPRSSWDGKDSYASVSHSRPGNANQLSTNSSTENILIATNSSTENILIATNSSTENILISTNSSTENILISTNSSTENILIANYCDTNHWLVSHNSSGIMRKTLKNPRFLLVCQPRNLAGSSTDSQHHTCPRRFESVGVKGTRFGSLCVRRRMPQWIKSLGSCTPPRGGSLLG